MNPDEPVTDELLYFEGSVTFLEPSVTNVTYDLSPNNLLSFGDTFSIFTRGMDFFFFEQNFRGLDLICIR